MKSLRLFLTLIGITLLTFSCSDDDNSENNSYIRIPDSVFESMLIDLGVDSDKKVNQQILTSDAKKVVKLDLPFSASFGSIMDLRGIEGFTNITFLSAPQHDISEIDLSKNDKLEFLNLTANNLNTIDLSNNKNLKEVGLESNLLSSITGLEQATNLLELDLSYNYFKELTVKNTLLEVLHMTDNDLTLLDISKCTQIKSMLLTTNKLAVLNLDNNTKLETLLISNNKLAGIDLKNNNSLTYLFISSNELESLDLSQNQKLLEIHVDRNPDLNCIKIESNQNIPNVYKSDSQQLSESCI